jgi:LEA14-like dessication related protein
LRVPRLPKVSLPHVTAARHSPERVELTFSLGVTNPNPFEVRLTTLGYDFKLAGESLSDGSLGAGARLGPSAQTRFDLSATLTPATHPDAAKLIAGGRLPYEVTGEVVVGGFRRAYSLEGELNL